MSEEKRTDEWGNTISDTNKKPSGDNFINFLKYAAAAFCFFMAYKASPIPDFLKGTIPKCDSIAITNMLEENKPWMQFSDYKQLDYKMFDEIRYCSVKVDGTSRDFTVTWQNEDKDRYLIHFL